MIKGDTVRRVAAAQPKILFQGSQIFSVARYLRQSSHNPRPTSTTPPTGTTAPDPPDVTAAGTFGWGTPSRADDFTAPTLSGWQVDDGTPDGQQRSAGAVTVQGGVLTVTGDARGTTGRLAWAPGSTYGRWEARVRVPAGPDYHAVLLLTPDSGAAATGGEIDFMEVADPARQAGDGVLRSPQHAPIGARVPVDATQWHNWALEWRPDGITAYLDGVPWWTVPPAQAALLPAGPLHLAIELDWFPTAAAPAPPRGRPVARGGVFPRGGPAPARSRSTGCGSTRSADGGGPPRSWSRRVTCQDVCVTIDADGPGGVHRWVDPPETGYLPAMATSGADRHTGRCR